MMHFSWANYG